VIFFRLNCQVLIIAPSVVEIVFNLSLEPSFNVPVMVELADDSKEPGEVAAIIKTLLDLLEGNQDFEEFAQDIREEEDSKQQQEGGIHPLVVAPRVQVSKAYSRQCSECEVSYSDGFDEVLSVIEAKLSNEAVLIGRVDIRVSVCDVAEHIK